MKLVSYEQNPAPYGWNNSILMAGMKLFVNTSDENIAMQRNKAIIYTMEALRIIGMENERNSTIHILISKMMV